MRIPETFSIGEKSYKVSLVQSIGTKGIHGQIHFPSGSILIAQSTSNKARDRTADEMTYTFLHEVTHAILENMWHRSYKNEKLVTDFSRRLASVVRTGGL